MAKTPRICMARVRHPRLHALPDLCFVDRSLPPPIAQSAQATAKSAHARFAAWIGADIRFTEPIAPARLNDPSAATIYGALLSAIPGWLRNEVTGLLGPVPYNTLAFAEAMRSDLAYDGVLDGVGRGTGGGAAPLAIGTTELTADVYRHQIAVQAVIRIRAETELLFVPGVDPERIVLFLPALTAYNDAQTPLIAAPPTVPLDETGPVIRILSPSAGAVLSASQGIGGSVYEIVGVPIYQTEMLIDGVVYTPFLDPYYPSHFINTTIFSNGAHTLAIRTTNRLGHVSTASVDVSFSN